MNDSAQTRLNDWSLVVRSFFSTNDELVSIARVAAVSLREFETTEAQLKAVLSDQLLARFTPNFAQLRVSWAAFIDSAVIDFETFDYKNANFEGSLAEVLIAYPELAPVEAMFRDHGVSERALKRLLGLFVVTAPIAKMSAHITRDKFLRGFLATLVAGLETFFSSLMLTYLKHFPRSSNLNDLGVTFEQIVELESIDEFRSFVSEREVEMVMSRSFDKWLDWLSAKDKKLISRAELQCADQVSDLILLRNVYLHNDGKPGRRHVQLSNDKSRFVFGKIRAMTLDDLERAVEQMNGLALSIWLSISKTIRGKDHEIGIILTEFQVLLLKARCYEAVRNTATLIPKGRLVESDVNIWFARKALGDTKVNAEVALWDATTSGEHHQMAKLILTDNTEDAWQVARSLYLRKELDASSIVDWPILESVRDLHGVDALIRIAQ